ncbi:ferrous iron transport protein A [Streptomyces sp. NBC_00102]|uniref:ferrous iron transport protein A n=1 Tax=Streptomyces sp. NBC_00102 TaxID=2975652 RepID=UPI002253E8F7|nr:ferrous iron transport protein A [Streptomyces sp. NBC_00102]MCX5396893.1 ferrous iron transport protein A [Streptomyces sp. NBC_00102]
MENESGTPPEGWPESAWPSGTRVRVVQSPEWAGPWPVEFRGTVDDLFPPAPVEHPDAAEGELAYWIRFDRSQRDSEGCGPYYEARIWSRYLRTEQDG